MKASNEGDDTMEDIHSIAINLLSSLLWVPVWAALLGIGYYIQVRRPHRKLWLLKNPSDLVVCAANSTTTHTNTYNRPATGIGQVRALALAIRSMHHAYRRQLNIRNILLSTDHLQERIENDLLILGGAKNNELAAKYLDLLSDEQPVLQIEETIYWRPRMKNGQWSSTGAAEYAGTAVGRQVVVDYGLIMRTYNPFTNRDRTAIFLSGSHTYGTVAATKYFVDDMPKKLRRLLKGGKKNFVVLVSAQIVNGYPTKLKWENSYVW